MNHSTKRILIVEDETVLREMVRLVLSEEEYQVDTAADGSEALEMLNHNKYDLVATDLYMPVMNGFELVRACKENFPHTRLILLSGGGRDFEAEQGEALIKYKNQEVLIDAFLKKPCKLDYLVSVVEEVLQKK